MEYSLKENGQVVNELGQVAMAHHDSNPCTIQVEGTDKVFSFVPRFNISLCWVEPEYVDRLLHIHAGMCCGKVVNKFQLANLNWVCQWQDNKRC